MEIIFAIAAALICWYAVLWIVNAHVMMLSENNSSKPYGVLLLTLITFLGVGVAGALLL